MENINNKIFSEKLSDYFKGNIKLSFVSEECAIVMTYNDECYIFERKDLKNKTKNSLIALSDDIGKVNSLIEESFIDVLSFKQVIDFKTNDDKILVRTIDGKIYHGERSEFKKLRKDFINFETKFRILVNEIVIDMCFKFKETFLTTNGIVYERQMDDLVKLNAFKNEKIKAIACGSYHSMALTESGRVYSMGHNYYGQLGRGNRLNYYLPKLVEMNEKLIWDKISCGQSHSLLLSSDGDIYVCGGNESEELGICDQKFIKTPTKLSHSEKFIDIASHFRHSFSAALSKNSVYYIWGKFEGKVITQLEKTEFKSFNDIFEMYFQISLEPVKGKLIQFNDDLVENDNYENKFIKKKRIGVGSYGEVFEVSEKYDLNMKYAVKKIKFNVKFEKEFMKELETSPIIYELRHENIVKYLNVWLENDYIYKNRIKTYIQNFILYIQMEFCDKSLNDVIDEIKNIPNFYSNETLTSLSYYISSQIFIQILEGVKFLHEQNPPIIHRDLNPWNILLKIEKCRTEFVKIADLGLATIHQYVNQSHTRDRGHYDYIAPEAKNSRKYDTRADIYSLGIVLQKLFSIDDQRDYKIQNESQSESFLINKYLEIINVYEKMTQRRVDKRPVNIEEILEYKQIWAFKFDEFNYKEEFGKVFNSKKSIESFVFKIFKKLIFYRKGKYSKKFIERKKICGGSFGEVFEVSEKYGSKHTYAIQKICLKTMNEELMRELKVIYEQSNKKMVKYLDVWFENGIETCIENSILYIQMRSNYISLAEMIEEIKNDSIFCSNGILTLLGYYFASLVFFEILQVYHFYKQTSPLIHGNLNPFNIMLQIEFNDLPDIKIAELDLVAFHDYTCQSHTEDRALQDYRAPEVRLNRSYNSSADIYSLGLVLKDLFLIDVKRDYKIQNESVSVLINKYVEIRNLCNRMTQTNVIGRPDVLSIFKESHLWCLDRKEFNFEEEIENLELINEITLSESITKRLINKYLTSIRNGSGNLGKFIATMINAFESRN